MSFIKKFSALKYIASIAVLVLVLCIPILIDSHIFALRNKPPFPQSGTWIDKTRIIYDGDEYIDGDIYDPTNDYGPGGVVNAGNETCESFIRDVNFDNNTGQARLSVPDEGGTCADHTDAYDFQIDLTNPADKFVNAYRRSDTVIFLPQGLTCGGNGISIDRIPAYYQKLAPDAAILQERPDLADKYLRITDNGTGDPANWVEVSGGEGTVHVDINGATNECGDDQHLLLYNNGGVTGKPDYAPPPPRGMDFNGTITVVTNPQGGDADASCESHFSNGIAWAVCGILGFIDDGLNKLEGGIEDLLIINLSSLNNDDLRDAWAYFRNIASALLVIIGLVMVIGQAVGRD